MNELLDTLAALNGPGHRCNRNLERESAPAGRERAFCKVCRRRFEKAEGAPRWGSVREERF